jgi:hypothetical protein
MTTTTTYPDVPLPEGAIHVDEFNDGKSCECLTITVEAARGLAAALLAAADQIDGWTAK